MDTIWEKTVDMPSYPPLKGTKKVETAVIGGGMAGILTAYFLAREGREVLVLEADRIGSGQTKGTTAKIAVSHGLIYEKLIREVGKDQARQYALMNQTAVRKYKELINDLQIDCDFKECDSYLYSRFRDEALKEEVHAAQSLGLPAVFADQTELPFSVAGAVRYAGQARFHPLKFLKAAAEGLEIYEHTMVNEVEGNRIITEHGTVEAENIVFATHYPIMNRPGYYFLRMHQERSYVVALTGTEQMEHMYLGIDPGDSLSFRSYGPYLLLGGGGDRTGENPLGGQYQMLKLTARQYWEHCRVDTEWSAQDCMTIDSIPYIGYYSYSRPGWFVATGFKKWGMSSSMASALLITDYIIERNNAFSHVFSPQRLHVKASAKALTKESAQTARGFILERFKIPKEEADQLKKGEGGLIEYEGKKAGAYKDENGEVFVVSLTCPHLGCVLQWNPEELTWDCPCHGSRFDYKGNLIDNPAKEDLTHEQPACISGDKEKEGIL